MKNTLLSSLILAALTAPGVAMAGEASPISANVGFTTDYLFRGISQTGSKPAIQGGIDYAHASGFYAGIWGSNISWLSDAGVANNASVELDTYLGFRNSLTEDFGYDVGFLRYNYPGSYAAAAVKADTNELYGAVSYKWITAKYSYSTGDTFGAAAAKGSNYLELNASYTLEDAGVTLGAHYGKQKYRGVNAGTGLTALSYSDYKLSASKDFSGYALGLAYSKTNAATGAGAAYHVLGKDLGKGTAVLSVTHSF